MRARKASLASLASTAALAIWANGLWAQPPAPAPAPAVAPQPAAPAAAAPAAPATAAPAAPINPSKPAATVNGEVITEGEVQPVIQMLTKERYKLYPPTDQQKKEMRIEVITMLVDDALMRQFLTKCGVKVEPAEVDKQIADLQTALQKETPPRNFQDFLKESGQTEAQIRLSILNMLRWAGYVKTRLKEEDVKKYYEDNKDFFDQVTVRASHILLRLDAKASEADKQAAKQKLEGLRADIVANKLDFAEAAKKYSQCTSAPAGGDIGFFSRKFMLEEPFSKAAFALPVGGVSDVIQTEAGLHLIKATDRKKGEPSDFAKIKDEVRDFYVEEMRQGLMAVERKAAKIDIMP